MFLSYIGIVVAMSLVIVPCLVWYIIRRRRNEQTEVEWLKSHETTMKATVIQVQAKQNWKYGERYHRDAWDGELRREKTWQTYYHVTAQWMHPQTKQNQLFHHDVWSGDRIPVSFIGKSVGGAYRFLASLKEPGNTEV